MPEPVAPPPGRSRWPGFAVGLAVWTVFPLLSVAAATLSLHARGQSVPWRSVIASNGLVWYGCAAFTPGLSLLVRRWPPQVRFRRLALYTGTTLLCAAVWSVLVFAGSRLIGGRGGVWRMAAAALPQMAIIGLALFAATIVVLHTLELTRRLRQREQVALGLRTRLSEAELEILKGQLQPHFLFNTLNGVASLIHTAPRTADFVLVQLADLLRASLAHRGTREISLRDELALLDKYLAIQAARFEDKVVIERRIAADAGAALVPQFLLQPLVENAFEHGLARRSGAGRVWIGASIEGGAPPRLRLEIGDDGAGLASAGDAREGVGLSNTRRRLEHLYDERQSLRLAPLPGGGTLVVVELPLRFA